jgi:hypothetical protein
MRKRNLSVYDIQRELSAAGHSRSINALATLLREEGFARLPRRADDERPQAVRPEVADNADVRLLSLAPRSFRTRLGGLFLFVPLRRDIRLATVLAQVDLPGSALIPAEQALRTLLGLELVGKERKSPVLDLVTDQGIALFAGLNVVPKRSYLAASSSRVDQRAGLRLLEAWSEEVHRVGLSCGNSFDLDSHTVPANSQEEPLEKHYVCCDTLSHVPVPAEIKAHGTGPRLATLLAYLARRRPPRRPAPNPGLRTRSHLYPFR